MQIKSYQTLKNKKWNNTSPSILFKSNAFTWEYLFSKVGKHTKIPNEIHAKVDILNSQFCARNDSIFAFGENIFFGTISQRRSQGRGMQHQSRATQYSIYDRIHRRFPFVSSDAGCHTIPTHLRPVEVFSKFSQNISPACSWTGKRCISVSNNSWWTTTSSSIFLQFDENVILLQCVRNAQTVPRTRNLSDSKVPIRLQISFVWPKRGVCPKFSVIAFIVVLKPILMPKQPSASSSTSTCIVEQLSNGFSSMCCSKRLACISSRFTDTFDCVRISKPKNRDLRLHPSTFRICILWNKIGFYASVSASK